MSGTNRSPGTHYFSGWGQSQQPAAAAPPIRRDMAAYGIPQNELSVVALRLSLTGRLVFVAKGLPRQPTILDGAADPTNWAGQASSNPSTEWVVVGHPLLADLPNAWLFQRHVLGRITTDLPLPVKWPCPCLLTEHHAGSILCSFAQLAPRGCADLRRTVTDDSSTATPDCASLTILQSLVDPADCNGICRLSKFRHPTASDVYTNCRRSRANGLGRTNIVEVTEVASQPIPSDLGARMQHISLSIPAKEEDRQLPVTPDHCRLQHPSSDLIGLIN
ncbi:hypothetical protein PG996_000087 [Apiospora saccharicola]|uniref:Uncharacterized protein n=1 Tax=Apiospora saccharicola TaxID=335842 RepID=A0ABR1WFL5_9PEZI